MSRAQMGPFSQAPHSYDEYDGLADMTARENRTHAGRLFIVPTPIGNLGDITLRALDVLKSADAVYAEDTRVTGKLLSALDVEATRPLRLDENTLSEKAEEVIARVQMGEMVAYCTDAGMPGVSDPGMRLVAAAREAACDVDVLPGASAAACAFVASGFPATSYYFGGFFPRKAGERAAMLESLSALDAALVFYESPKRLASALQAVAEVFPHRRVAVCRELTKLHEEVFVASATDAAAEFVRRETEGGIKGEIAFVVSPPTTAEGEAAKATSKSEAEVEAARMARAGESQKSIAKALASKFGIPRNDAYEIALAAKRPEDATS